MNSDAFQALIDLVSFDQETVSFKKNIKTIKNEIQALKVERSDLEANIQQEKDILHNTQKEVDMGELEMKEYDQRIKEEKVRLDKVKNQKEYASILKEIEHLEQKQHDAEEPLLVAWNKLEQVKQGMSKKEDDFNEKYSEINQQLEQKNKQIEQIEIELQDQSKQRDQKVNAVPQEWLEKYNMLGARVEDPVVPILGGSCSACFYDIPSQKIIEMKRGKLVQCNGCYRFLYIKQDEQ